MIVTGRIKLYGFNNLSKAMGVSLYDVAYIEDALEREQYIQQMDEHYHAEYLASILQDVTEKIGAKVLTISTQNYVPQGASAVLLLEEDSTVYGSYSRQVSAHLDKSHVTVHTYPDTFPNSPLTTFRLDINVETCGDISPLTTLKKLMDEFNPDLMTVDYKVRGYTRSEQGRPLITDGDSMSVLAHIDLERLEKYEFKDYSMEQLQLYHMRLKRKFDETYYHSKTNGEIQKQLLEDFLGQIYQPD